MKCKYKCDKENTQTKRREGATKKNICVQQIVQRELSRIQENQRKRYTTVYCRPEPQRIFTAMVQKLSKNWTKKAHQQ